MNRSHAEQLRPLSKSIALSLSLALAIAAPSVHAASKFWDLDAAAGLQGGNGVWDTGTTALWSTANTGTALDVWNASDDAIFQTGVANTLTLSGTILANSVQVLRTPTPTFLDTTSLTLTGGTLQITNNAGFTNNTYNPIVVNSAVTANVGSNLAFVGVGNLTINGLYTNQNITAVGWSTANVGGTLTFAGGIDLGGGTNAMRIQVTGPGQTTLLSGNITSTSTLTNGVGLTLLPDGAGGRIIVSGNNTFVADGGGTGTDGALGVTIGGSNRGTIGIGSNTAFGAATNVVGFNQSSIEAVGGARTIANPMRIATTTSANSFVGLNTLTLTSAFSGNTNNTSGRFDNNASALLTLAGGLSIKGFSTDATNRTFTFGGTGNTLISGAVVDGGTGGGLGTFTLKGPGTVTMSGANTFSNSMNVDGGTLRLDYSAQDNSKIPDAPTLNLSANIVLVGGTHAEAAGALTLNTTAGSSITRESGAATLSVGTITRNAGTTLDVSGGVVSTSTGTASTLLTATAGAYATVGGADWAAKDGSNSLIVGFSTVGSYSPTTATNLGGAGNQSDVSAAVDTTLTANESTSTLRFNQNEARTVSIGAGQILSLTQGGVLVTPAVNPGAGTTTIAGPGTLTPGTNNALQIINNSPKGLTIGAVIGNNGATANVVTIGGSGTTTLTGANIYTGATHAIGGKLVISSNANLGAVATGAALNLNNVILVADTTGGSFALDNGGANSRAVNIEEFGATIEVMGTNTFTISGVVNGGM